MSFDPTLNQLQSDPGNPNLYITLARAHLEAGREDKAREVAIQRRTLHTSDPAVHRAWADLCLDLGLARQARDSFHQALRLKPDDTDTLLSFADFLADIGQFEDSIRCLKKVLRYDSANSEAREALSEHYRALGLFGQAEALLPRMKTPEPAAEPRYFPPSVSEEDAAALFRLFEGREIGYALSGTNANNGQIFYANQNEVLTLEKIKAHLQGEITLAVYPLRADKTVKVTGVSLRLPSSVLEANVKNTGFLAFLKERMKTYLLALGRLASQFKIPAYMEDGSEYQFRLWFFFDRFIHFLKAKSFINDFIKKIPPPVGLILTEPLLPTVAIGFGWLEQPLFLPLGINPASLKRSLFLDTEGKPYPDQLKNLRKIREIVPTRAFRVTSQSGVASHSTIMSIPRPPGPFQSLLAKCAVLRHLNQKARSGRLLCSEEKAILFYTIGLLDGGGERIHQLLEPCPDYNYEKVRRQSLRLKPNPVSCLKIRAWVPELTASVRCNCIFDLRGGKYPSPLLHVDPHAVPTALEFEPAEDLPLREIAQRYVRIRQYGEEVERTRSRLEAFLEKQFGKKQITRLKVSDLILVKESAEGKTRWRLEYA